MKRMGSLPWESPNSRRGRPRKEFVETPGCQWPVPATGSTCGGTTVKGLTLCASHGVVLEEAPGRTCAWPLCSQSVSSKRLCPYHLKRAVGLLEPVR